MRGTFKLDQHKTLTKASRRAARSRASWSRICSRFARRTPPARSTRTLNRSAVSGHPQAAETPARDHPEMFGYSWPARRRSSSTFATAARPTSRSAGVDPPLLAGVKMIGGYQRCHRHRRLSGSHMEVFAPLVRNLMRVVFSFRAAAKYKRREVVAHECFRLAGPTGLEP